ncbi:MAG TPA: hypothetical protein VFC76_00660, partial [Oscillospiraceae bacterium]|nr:hypothetical protein [Oscillospiraceae bacterium]
MLFFLIALGIIAFFILVLSIRVTVLIEYKDYIELKIKWLFLKFDLLPLIEKLAEKESAAQSEEESGTKDEAISESDPKPEKEIQLQTAAAQKSEPLPAADKTESAEKAEETETDLAEKSKKTEKAKTAANPQSILKDLWNAHGYDGLVKMLKDSVDALNKFLGSTLKAIIIDELYYTMVVSKPDAAQTAIEYGKVCMELYPLFGSIVSRLKTRRYDINIHPDYIAYKNEMYLRVKLLVIPRKILNAAIVFVVRLLFKVVLKVLVKLLRKPKKQSKIKNNK